MPDITLTDDDMAEALMAPGPVWTMSIVHGRATILKDGMPDPDHPWQQAFDAQQNEVDRVMVRAVQTHLSTSFSYDDQGLAVWLIDGDATAHRAPFQVDDLVVASPGRSGIHQVVEVQFSSEHPGMIRLVVGRAFDLVYDREAF